MWARLVSLFNSSDEYQQKQAEKAFEILDIEEVTHTVGPSQLPYHSLADHQDEQVLPPLPSSISMQILREPETNQAEQENVTETPSQVDTVTTETEPTLAPAAELVEPGQALVPISTAESQSRTAVSLISPNVVFEVVKNTAVFAFFVEGLWVTALIAYNLKNLDAKYGQTWKGAVLGAQDDPDLYPYPNAIADHFWQDRPDQNDYFTNIELSLIEPILLGTIYAAVKTKKINNPENTSRIVKILLYTLYALTPLGMLAYSRVIYSLVNKSEVRKIYEENKLQCEATGKSYDYIDAISDYLCSVCGTWEDVDVYLKDTANPQKCLDAVLAKTRNPDVISKYVEKLAQFSGYTALDFSQQDYGRWNSSDFANLFQQFKAMNMSLDLFSLARTNATRYAAVSSAQIEILADFVKTTPIKTLTLAGNDFGVHLEKRFFEKDKNVAFDALVLSSTNLDVTESNSMAHVRANNIKLDKSRLTDKSAGIFLNNTEASTAINLSGNPLTGITLINLGKLDYKNQIEQLDISDFAKVTSEDLTHLKSFTSLKYLRASGNGLAKNDLVSISESIPASLINLDVSRNTFDQARTAKLFFKKLLPTLKELNLSDMDFGDAAVPFLESYLSSGSVEVLNLSHSRMGVESFKSFMMSVVNSNVKYLKLNNAMLSVDHLYVLAEILSTYKHNIKIIELSGNNIIDAPARKLIEAFRTSGVEVFDLSSNLITTQSGLVIAEAIPHSNFTKVDISRNPINGAAIIAIVDAKKLQSLIADSVAINEDDAITISKKLVTFRYDLSFLGNEQLTPFEKRMLSQAEPATDLKEFSLMNCGLTPASQSILSRVAASAGFSAGNFRVNNVIDSVDQHQFQYLVAANFTANGQPRFNLPANDSIVNQAPHNDLILYLSSSLLFIFFLWQLCKKYIVPISRDAFKRNNFFANTQPANDSILENTYKTTRKQGV